MMIVEQTHAKQTMSLPGVLLRLEGLAVLVGVVVLYANSGFSWWTFALCLLAPDVAIAAYYINKDVGAIAYNFVHSYILPLLLAILCFVGDTPFGLQIGLIWLAHIGMDRCVGYGLKYTTDFKDTHLSRV